MQPRSVGKDGGSVTDGGFRKDARFTGSFGFFRSSGRFSHGDEQGRIAAAETRNHLQEGGFVGLHRLLRHLDGGGGSGVFAPDRPEHAVMQQFLRGEDHLKDSGGTERVAEVAFQAVDGDVDEAGAFHRHRLHIVVVAGGRAVGIDESEISNIESVKYLRNGGEKTFRRARRAGDVVGVVANGTGSEAQTGLSGGDVGAVTGIDDGGRRLAKVQPRAVGIERTALLRRQCLEGLEAGNDELGKHVRANDDGVTVTVVMKEAGGGHLGGTARNAGVADDHRLVRIAEMAGDQLRRTPQIGTFRLVAAEIFQKLHIAFSGGKDKNDLLISGIDARICQSICSRQNGHFFHLCIFFFLIIRKF